MNESSERVRYSSSHSKYIYKIHIFELRCNVLFILVYMETITQTQTAMKKRKMASSISSLVRMRKITPLGSQMQFHMNFTSGVFSSKMPVSI